MSKATEKEAAEKAAKTKELKAKKAAREALIAEADKKALAVAAKIKAEKAAKAEAKKAEKAEAEKAPGEAPKAKAKKESSVKAWVREQNIDLVAHPIAKTEFMLDVYCSDKLGLNDPKFMASASASDKENLLAEIVEGVNEILKP